MDSNENNSCPNSFSDDASDDHTRVFQAEIGPRTRLGLWTLVPALVVFLICIAFPTIMLWYLLSRPAISPAAEDMHLFDGAIIAVEGSEESTTVSDSGQAQVSPLYGLAFATTIVRMFRIPHDRMVIHLLSTESYRFDHSPIVNGFNSIPYCYQMAKFTFRTG